jgi:hypothetical protein
MHDFNPGITPNGVFWILQIPDSAVQTTDKTLTIHLQNASVVDQFQFPAGTGNVPATVSFDITYTKSGTPRHVQPTSTDPLSPFTWAGEMWMATNSGTFSVSYNDNSFSAQGTFSSSGNFGEMGEERNGSFVGREIDPAEPLSPRSDPISKAESQQNESAAEADNTPKFKGRVPLSRFIH